MSYVLLFLKSITKFEGKVVKNLDAKMTEVCNKYRYSGIISEKGKFIGIIGNMGYKN